MKAYTVSCRDDDHGSEVTFAERSKDADKGANSGRCDCPWIERTVRRSPQFDKYGSGNVGTREKLNEGWHFECDGCSRFVTKDDDPIVINEYAYHSRECVDLARSRWDEGDAGRWHESVRKYLNAIDLWLAEHLPISAGGGT